MVCSKSLRRFDCAGSFLMNGCSHLAVFYLFCSGLLLPCSLLPVRSRCFGGLAHSQLFSACCCLCSRSESAESVRPRKLRAKERGPSPRSRRIRQSDMLVWHL